VYGSTGDTARAGVFGTSSVDLGGSGLTLARTGVEGKSTDNVRGRLGYSVKLGGLTTTYGVHGEGKEGNFGYGVWGSGKTSGVHGTSSTGRGVYGSSGASNQAGVYATNTGAGPALEVGSGWIKMQSQTVAASTGTLVTGFLPYYEIILNKSLGVIENDVGTDHLIKVFNNRVTANSIIMTTVQNRGGATGIYEMAPGEFQIYTRNGEKVAFLVIN
jgi:hypothetical protein